MYKSLFVLVMVLLVSGCGCHCRYNEYLPENNPLVIPDELKPVENK